MVAFVCECGFRAELSAEQRKRLAALAGSRVKCPKCGKSANVSQANPPEKVIDTSVDDRGVDLESSGTPEFGGSERPAWLNRRLSDNDDEFDDIKSENAGAKLDGFNDDDILNALSESKQATSNATERIPCRLCGEEILAVAQKCKHCGEFQDEDRSQRERMAAVVPRHKASIPATITVEFTSKAWKRIQVQGVVGVAASVFLFFLGALTHGFVSFLAGIGIVVSLCWWLFGRIGAWWDHG